MRKYWGLTKISWQRALVHRTNAILEIFGNLITMAASIGLWMFAFKHTGQSIIGGYSAQQMMAYLLIAGWLASSFWFTAQGDRIVYEIKNGEISNYLAKPISVFFYQFVYGAAGKLSQFFWGAIAFTLVLLVTGLYVYLSLAWTNIAIFILFFIFAFLIQWLIFHSAALLAFWMDEVWGVTFCIRVLADVAAGTFLPLALFAPFWQNFFDFLPFKYIVSVPVNALLGRMNSADISHGLVGAVVWLAILCLLAFIGMRRGLRHYSAVGG